MLGPDRLAIRRRELASTLSDARAVAPQAETLRGGSWLYHLAPYRSLFPPSFLASATTSVEELLNAFPWPRLNLFGSIDDVQAWLRIGLGTDRQA